MLCILYYLSIYVFPRPLIPMCHQMVFGSHGTGWGKAYPLWSWFLVCSMKISLPQAAIPSLSSIFSSPSWPSHPSTPPPHPFFWIFPGTVFISAIIHCRKIICCPKWVFYQWAWYSLGASGSNSWSWLDLVDPIPAPGRVLGLGFGSLGLLFLTMTVVAA